MSRPVGFGTPLDDGLGSDLLYSEAFGKCKSMSKRYTSFATHTQGKMTFLMRSSQELKTSLT